MVINYELRSKSSIKLDYKLVSFRSTYYHALKSQTDSDPLITADGSKIRKKHISRLRWLAISRDMLHTKYEFGDTVLIYSNNQTLNGRWVVKDIMNKRFKNSFDFLMPETFKNKKFPDSIQILKISTRW